MHGQHTMQFSQTLPQQQLQRQLASGHVQNVMGQTQLIQGNSLNRQMNQFQAGANTALYNAVQTTPSSQMVRLFALSNLMHFSLAVYNLFIVTCERLHLFFFVTHAAMVKRSLQAGKHYH